MPFTGIAFSFGALVFIFICFYPALENSFKSNFLNNNDDNPSILDAASVSYGLISSLVVCGFKIFDVFVDYWFDYHRISFLRWYRILYFSLPQLIMLILLRPFEATEYIPCLISAQSILFIHGSSIFLYKFGDPVFTSRTCIFISTLFATTASLNCIFSFYPRCQSKSLFLAVLPGLLFSIGYFLFILKTIIWFRRLYKNTEKFTNSLSNDQYCCSITVAITNIYILLIIVIECYFYNEQNLSEAHLAALIYSAVFFIIIISQFSDKIMLRELNSTMRKLEFKRAFIRYVSHEIRTPLNIVNMGLKLLHEDIASSSPSPVMDPLFPLSSTKSTASINNNTTARTTDEILQDIKDMMSSCTTAITTLNELLTLDKIESGSLILEKKELPVWPFVTDIIKLFSIQARSAGVHFKIENKEASKQSLSNSFLVADPHKLSQVIRNLISNALKFTPIGGNVTINLSRNVTALNQPLISNFHGFNANKIHADGISLAATASASASAIQATNSDSHQEILRIEVHDDGVGISKENQAKLFKEIIQFNAGELQAGGGSGIGLYVSKSIMELHGGDITVTSEGEGRGCTFIIEMPVFTAMTGIQIQDSSSSTHRHPTLVRQNSTSSRSNKHSSRRASVFQVLTRHPFIGSRNIRLLVVDDSVMNRKMLQRSLLKYCDILDSACEGATASAMVLEAQHTNRPYHAILMDSNMPIMDGPTAAQTMRLAGYQGVIIGVTGDVNEDRINHFILHGADRVLAKPVNIEELVNIINDIKCSIDNNIPSPTANIPESKTNN